jgi:hypothetical protein
MKMIKRGDFDIAPKLLIVLISIFVMSCSSTTNQIKSGEEYGAKSGAGNFMVVDDKTYVVNNDGELIDITGSLITEGAGKHLAGEGFRPGDNVWIADAQTGIIGYIQNVETGSGIFITSNGYYSFTQQNFDETFTHLSSGDEDAVSNAEMNADKRLKNVDHQAALGKAKHEIVQKQIEPGNCIENGIERLRDKDFTYCISRFKSGYKVTYTCGDSSIIYAEKTDDLKSFKQNCELSRFVDLVNR